MCKHPGCGSSFITKGHLKDQTRMHTNDRPYVCTECGRGFMRSTTLKVHLRIHSGERPYVCTYPGCGKTFTESGNLNTHKKLHKINETKEHENHNIEKEVNNEEKACSAFKPYKRGLPPNSEQNIISLPSLNIDQLNSMAKNHTTLHPSVNSINGINMPYFHD